MVKRVAGTMAMLLSAAGLARAAEQAPAAAGQTQPFLAGFFGTTSGTIMIGLAVAAGLCGIGQGIAVASALTGISRQPEADSKIQLNMIIGLAFIESLVLYTLFIGIVLLFVNPFAKYVVR